MQYYRTEMIYLEVNLKATNETKLNKWKMVSKNEPP
jgi:hypothetical protein